MGDTPDGRTRDGSGGCRMVSGPPGRQARPMTNAEPSAPFNDQPAWEQAPPASAPARPQLRRSSTDRMIGGVSGGLAEYSGIDAVLWRGGLLAPPPPRGARGGLFPPPWGPLPGRPPPAPAHTPPPPHPGPT